MIIVYRNRCFSKFEIGSIVYGNQNNGIRTTDIVYLTIDGSGQLVGYSTPNIGEFDNVNLTNIVIEEAKKEALGKYVLKGDFDSTNDLVATNAVLTKKDNQFVLLVDIEGSVIRNSSEENVYDVVEVEIKVD